jgi:hypothetical protein
MPVARGRADPVAGARARHLRRDSLGGLYEKVFLGMELIWLLVAALAAAHFSESGAGDDAPAAGS